MNYVYVFYHANHSNSRDIDSQIPYSRKFIGGSYLAVWPQSDCKKILAEFKFGGGVSGLFIKEHCCLLLEVLEQSHEFENLAPS